MQQHSHILQKMQDSFALHYFCICKCQANLSEVKNSFWTGQTRKLLLYCWTANCLKKCCLFNGFCSHLCYLLLSLSLSPRCLTLKHHRVIDFVCHLPYNSKSSQFSCLPTQHARSDLLQAGLQISLLLVASPKSILLILALELIVPFRIVNAAVFTTPTFISYPFHLSLPFPSSNSLEHADTQRRNKEPHISVRVPVPLKLELTNFLRLLAAHDRVTEDFYSELVVYQELLEMSEKDICMYSRQKKKFQNVLKNVSKTLNCPGFLSWL